MKIKIIVLFFLLHYCTVVLSQEIKSEFQNEISYKVPNLNLSGQDKIDINKYSRVIFNTICTQSVIPPVVLNGVNVTSTYTGDVQIFPNSYSSCTAGYITPDNSIWLGQMSNFNYTFNFSQPVNNLVIVITATGQDYDEIFNFTTSSGNPLILDNGSCFSSIVGSTIISGAGADYLTGGGGGVFTITATTPFTSLTISGPGNQNGSLFALCSQSVSPVLCTIDTLTPLLSSNSLTTICPNTTINLNDVSALNAPSIAGVSLAWFTSSLPSVTNQLTNNQISNALPGVTYYAAFFDETNSCYSISTPVTTTLNSTITPLFDQVSPVCEGDFFILPLISNNQISGVWTPEINTNTTTTYTFTPTSNLCAISVTMTVVVNQKVTPTFFQIPPICEGSSFTLPIVSNNGILGTWFPSNNYNSTTTYTFTPNNGLCANVITMTIEVNQKTDPVFSVETTLCYGTIFTLPSISNNGINGTWTPEWNSLTTTTYSFIPNSDECANPKTITIAILNDFDFEIFNNCIDGNYFLMSNPINASFSESTSIYDWIYNAISIGSTTTLDVTSYIESNNIVYTLPITYNLKITNDNGCIKSKEFVIDNLYCKIQKGISPNGDGFNDFFDLRLLNVKKINIYNRFGVNVYSKENYYNEWNGQTNDNKILPDGVYYYHIEFKNNNEIKTGWIYINR